MIPSIRPAQERDALCHIVVHTRSVIYQNSGLAHPKLVNIARFRNDSRGQTRTFPPRFDGKL